MKKFILRAIVLIIAVITMLCCMGIDVTEEGEFQGFSCALAECNRKCEHSYEVTEEINATCYEDGHVTYTCFKCGDSKSDIISKLSHDFDYKLHRGLCNLVDEGELSSYTYSWYNDCVCKRCDYSMKDYLYSGSGQNKLHYYGEGETVLNGDNACGNVVYTCLLCGDIKTETFHCDESPQVQECNEKLAETEKFNRCTAYYKTCEICDKPLSAELHSKAFVKEILVDPTSDMYGLAKFICGKGNCTFYNNYYFELIPPLNN